MNREETVLGDVSKGTRIAPEVLTNLDLADRLAIKLGPPPLADYETDQFFQDIFGVIVKGFPNPNFLTVLISAELKRMGAAH